jgi:hypothetical protein
MLERRFQELRGVCFPAALIPCNAVPYPVVPCSDGPTSDSLSYIRVAARHASNALGGSTLCGWARA